MYPANQITRTVKVIVRHSADCKHKDKGPQYRGCQCRKSLWIYEAGRERRMTTKTRSWSEAEDRAKDIRDSWDPEKQELKRLRAQKEAQQVRLEEAVALYTADMVARLGDNGTVAMARSLLGHVDPDTKAVSKNGHLFDWLDTIPSAKRPTHIADITPPHLTAWRATWKFADYTAAQRWGMVRSFFKFCEAQGWIQDSPARKLRRVEYKKGSRTCIFTDDQYNAILAAVKQDDPPNVPAPTRATWQQRLTTFVELLRWSGMAPIDAVQWRPELVDGEGVLRYRRQKTGELATVQLPDHLLTLLREIPVERDSVGPGQPFRMKGFTPLSDRITWGKRLIRLFALAGIKEVRNELGRMRKPHPYMFRDTFAVSKLRHGASLYAVAKMLGHSDPTTTAKAYLPWVKELEALTNAEGRKALASEMPKPAKSTKVVKITNR